MRRIEHTMNNYAWKHASAQTSHGHTHTQAINVCLGLGLRGAETREPN